MKLDTVHLIPPSGEVKIKTYKLQKLSIEDARMIVRRKIMVEEGIEEPVFHLRPYGSGGRHQEFIATITDPERLQKVCNALFRIRDKSEECCLRHFMRSSRPLNSMKSETPQTCAIFEVGTDSVEIMVCIIFQDHYP